MQDKLITRLIDVIMRREGQELLARKRLRHGNVAEEYFFGRRSI